MTLSYEKLMKVDVIKTDREKLPGLRIVLPAILSFELDDTTQIHIAMGPDLSNVDTLITSLLRHWLKQEFRTSFIENHQGYELAYAAFYDSVTALSKSVSFIASFITMNSKRETGDASKDVVRQFMRGGRLVRWGSSGLAHARAHPNSRSGIVLVFFDGIPGAITLTSSRRQLESQKSKIQDVSAWYGFGRTKREFAEIIQYLRK